MRYKMCLSWDRKAVYKGKNSRDFIFIKKGHKNSICDQRQRASLMMNSSMPTLTQCRQLQKVTASRNVSFNEKTRKKGIWYQIRSHLGQRNTNIQKKFFFIVNVALDSRALLSYDCTKVIRSEKKTLLFRLPSKILFLSDSKKGT